MYRVAAFAVALVALCLTSLGPAAAASPSVSGLGPVVTSFTYGSHYTGTCDQTQAQGPLVIVTGSGSQTTVEQGLYTLVDKEGGLGYNCTGTTFTGPGVSCGALSPQYANTYFQPIYTDVLDYIFSGTCTVGPTTGPVTIELRGTITQGVTEGLGVGVLTITG
jgi:hypothetical protein